MRSKVALVLYYVKANKYSLNSILASIEYNNVPVDTYVVWRNEALFETINRLRNLYEKVIVGLSFFTTQLPEILGLVKLIKQYFPEVTVIGGGPHVTGDPVGSLIRIGFDYIFYGEAEETIRDFLNAVSEGDDVKSICGIGYVDGDRVIVHRRAGKINLDDYPPFPYWRRMFNPIEIMRGCPIGCKFCQVTFMHGGKPRFRSIETILKYAKIMWSMGLRDLRFIAPNSLGYMSINGVSPNHSAICELLDKLHKLSKERGGRIFFGTFPSEVRPDSVDEDIIKDIRRYVANKSIIIGAQSGSNRLLKVINRKHTIEDVFNAVEIIVKNGFRPDVDFIFGLPHEDKEDVEETMKAIDKLVKMGARIHAHTFMPLPGTPFANAPPGKIPIQVKKKLYRLIGDGILYGQWIMQESLAEMIDWFRKNNYIYVGRKLSEKAKFMAC